MTLLSKSERQKIGREAVDRSTPVFRYFYMRSQKSELAEIFCGWEATVQKSVHSDRRTLFVGRYYA